MGTTREQIEIYEELGELEDGVDTIELSYNDILKLIPAFEEYGVMYHGTSSSQISREVLPPNKTFVISEKGRKKNLDSVFFTKDKKSAKIYAKRASDAYGGAPRVLKVVPQGSVTKINETQGTTVYHAPRAIVLSKPLERILIDLSKK